MKPVRVALAQIAPRLGDTQANLEKHAHAVKAARSEKAGLVVFPELAMTGYLLRDQVPDVAMSESSRAFKAVLALSRSIDVITGLALEGPDHTFSNAAIYASQGRLVHVHRKVYLPTYGMFDEGRDFASGEVVRAFDAPFGRAGMLICEDAWHPTCAWLAVQDGVDCTPLAGAAVYAWHCDRDGNYSLYSQAAANENYLRGVQAAGDDGVVTFDSIFPAAYQGRWPHIHFEVYPNLSAATSASDMVFSDGASLELATMAGSVGAGFTATLTVAV